MEEVLLEQAVSHNLTIRICILLNCVLLSGYLFNM